MGDNKYPKGVREHYGKLQIFFKPKGYKNYLYRTVAETISANQIKAAVRLRQTIVNEIKYDTFEMVNYFPDSVHAVATDSPLEKSFSYYAQLWASNPDNDWKPASRAKNLSILNYLWMPVFHNAVISSIEYSDITKVITKRIAKFKKQFDRDPSAGLYNSWIGVIRAVFNEAAKDRQSRVLLKDNPTLYFTHKKRPKTLVEQFNLDEMNLIIDDIYQHDGMMFGAWFELGFFTGMRCPSEPSALQWSNVDFARDEIRVKQIRTKVGIQETTKTGVHRIVKLNDRSRQALLNLRELTGFKNEWVFEQADGRPIISGDPQRIVWKACLRRLGFAYQDPYTMRHSYASFCLMQGLKPGFVCVQLGHSLEEFFKTYAKWINSVNDDNEIEKLNSALTPDGKKWAKSGRKAPEKFKSVIKQLVNGAKGETRKK